MYAVAIVLRGDRELKHYLNHQKYQTETCSDRTSRHNLFHCGK